MSRFWPHPRYHDEQPYSHAILYTHSLTRGAQVGSLLGSGVGTALFLLRYSRVLAPNPASFTGTLLRSAGVGAVVGTGLLAVGVPMRMWGREEIEWQDRSWRILDNRGQVELDDWTYGGMAAGLVAALANGKGLGFRGVAGSVGLGSLAGTIGFIGWRHGLKGGKFKEVVDS